MPCLDLLGEEGKARVEVSGAVSGFGARLPGAQASGGHPREGDRHGAEAERAGVGVSGYLYQTFRLLCSLSN